MVRRHLTRMTGLLLVVSLTAVTGCEAEQSPSPRVSLPDFTGLVKHVSPAVVNISTQPARHGAPARDNGADNHSPNDSTGNDNALGDWLDRFFRSAPDGGEPRQRPPAPHGMPRASLGSGLIISEHGYILTNRHVVADAGRIVVKLNDRRQLLAKVVGQDSYSDLAVLKVAADDLPTVEIGDPQKLKVGSWVVAIGSPFGFETSVTAGIVSAKQRNLANDQYVPFLQTDVAINPGNSGGPLFNLAGEVVGINSQIYSQTGGYQGVSFAIPIDIAMDVAGQLRDSGNVTRGWLGVQIQDVDRELARSFDLERPRGALVARVLADSPAAGAGIEPGDVILAFNGHEVASAAALPPLVGTVSPGRQARVEILRDGRRQTIQTTIEALPGRMLAAGSAADSSATERSGYGLTLETLSQAQRREHGLERGGVRVTRVERGPAARAGLKAGDIVLAVGEARIESAQSLRAALDRAEGSVALLVRRGDRRLYLAMRPRDS